MKSKLITTLQTALFAIHKGLERYPKILPGMTLVQLLAVDRGNYTPTHNVRYADYLASLVE